MDGHQAITFEEYRAAILASHSSSDTSVLETAFHALDRNGDNELDFHELIGSMRKMKQKMKTNY